MFVTWKPENGENDVNWDFDPDELLNSESRAIEKAYGESFEQWMNGLRLSEAKARAVLLWHLLRQAHPKVRFEDTPDFRNRQLKVEMSSSEIVKLRDRMSRTRMNDDRREALMAAIDVDLQDAYGREGKAVDGDLFGTDGVEIALPKHL